MIDLTAHCFTVFKTLFSKSMFLSVPKKLLQVTLELQQLVNFIDKLINRTLISDSFDYGLIVLSGFSCMNDKHFLTVNRI